MAKKLTFKVKDEQGVVKDATFVAENTWVLRSQELLRHEHYLQMASMANISPSIVACDIQPVQENGMMVCYRVSGPDINGLMRHSVGSAAPGNVKMQGAYYPEMAFKRAFDTWASTALGLDDQNIGSQTGAMNVESDDISQPELVLVDFGKHRGKTLGDVWNENQSWITGWLLTEKFEPKNEAALFLKKSGIALAQKMQGGNVTQGNNNQKQPNEQSNNQQQPNEQSNNQQPTNTQSNNQQQPNAQSNNQQQPNTQHYNQQPTNTHGNNASNNQPTQQNDINMLKAQLQNFWVSKGYDNNNAGIAINGYFKTNSISWANISVEQVTQLLANKDIVFVPLNSNFSQSSNQNNQQPVANNQNNQNNQQPVANNQNNQNNQQPVANNQNNQKPVMQSPVPNQATSGQVFCDNANAHSQQPRVLRQSEINFSLQNSGLYNGKKYCMDCMSKIKNNGNGKTF